MRTFISRSQLGTLYTIQDVSVRNAEYTYLGELHRRHSYALTATFDAVVEVRGPEGAVESHTTRGQVTSYEGPMAPSSGVTYSFRGLPSRVSASLSKELSQAPGNDIDRAVAAYVTAKNIRRANVSEQEPHRLLLDLLALVRAVQQLHQNAHWGSSGDTSYQDHLLFERMYEAVGPEIDALAEKLMGVYGLEIDSVDQAQRVAGFVTFLESQARLGYPERSFIAEMVVIEHINAVRDALGDRMSMGMEDLLGAVSSTHETHLYLLGQRLKGVAGVSA
jgi:DNA-binding ferritin-like protein